MVCGGEKIEGHPYRTIISGEKGKKGSPPNETGIALRNAWEYSEEQGSIYLISIIKSSRI